MCREIEYQECSTKQLSSIIDIEANKPVCSVYCARPLQNNDVTQLDKFLLSTDSDTPTNESTYPSSSHDDRSESKEEIELL